MPRNEALDRAAAPGDHLTRDWRARDWRKQMSDTVAYSLLAYTGLHIFATVKAMQETGYQSLSLVALVVLVFGIIPLWRRIEQRWSGLTDEQAADMAYAGAYRRDQMIVWLVAIGVPVGLTMVLKLALGAG